MGFTLPFQLRVASVAIERVLHATGGSLLCSECPRTTSRARRTSVEETISWAYGQVLSETSETTRTQRPITSAPDRTHTGESEEDYDLELALELNTDDTVVPWCVAWLVWFDFAQRTENLARGTDPGTPSDTLLSNVPQPNARQALVNV